MHALRPRARLGTTLPIHSYTKHTILARLVSRAPFRAPSSAKRSQHGTVLRCGGGAPLARPIIDLGEILSSPFFTAGVARLAERRCTILEINDGGCSTLSEPMDRREIYCAVIR